MKIFNQLNVNYIVFSIILVLLGIYSLATWNFYTDDAFITFRYGKNLASNIGINWNLLDNIPVEGYSNLLYVLISALLEKTVGNSIIGIKIINMVFLVGALITSYKLARLFANRTASAFAPLLIICYPGYVWWAASGLETPAYIFITLLTFLLTLKTLINGKGKEPSPFMLALIGLIVFLATLLRPEAGILGIAVAAIYISYKLPTAHSFISLLVDKGAWIVFSSFAIPFFAYNFWRYQYFGEILPNTVYCKSGYPKNPTIIIDNFIDLAWPLILLAALLGRKLLNFKYIGFITFISITLATLYNVDPIIGYYNRHTLAAYACTIMLATFTLNSIFNTLKLKNYLIIGLATFLAFNALDIYSPNKIEKRAENYQMRMSAREDVGKYLNQNTTINDWIAIGDCGITPYTSHANFYDLYCLNSKEYTSESIGKDKGKYGDYVIRQLPKYIILASKSSAEMKPRSHINSYIYNSGDFSENYTANKVIGHHTFNYWIFKRNN